MSRQRHNNQRLDIIISPIPISDSPVHTEITTLDVFGILGLLLVLAEVIWLLSNIKCNISLSAIKNNEVSIYYE